MTTEALSIPEVRELFSTLGEHKFHARLRIARIVSVIGMDMARELLRETQAIEANGGMLTVDGSQRRTLGGVWFRLAKERMTDEQHIRVYGFKRGTGKPRQQVPAEPPFVWTDRASYIAEVSKDKGEVKTVKVQLIGRPKKIVERADCALLMMQHRGPLPALPKGIPVPSKVPTTDYVVWIGAKQWKKVREAIRQPDDMLIVDGTQIYDQEFSAITIFASNVTTKALQQKQRESNSG